MGEFAQYGDAFATRNHERQPSMPSSNLNAILRALPSVEEVLNAPEIKRLERNLPRTVLTDAVRDELNAARQAIIESRGEQPMPADLPARAARRAMALLSPSLKRVVNASGVIVHTNLGRSVMAQSAVDAVVDVARGYSTLEYSVEGMCRGSRHDHCEQLICTLTGAEAAIAVNNNAAAVMMVLSEFASGHEAVVSRVEHPQSGNLSAGGGALPMRDIPTFAVQLSFKQGSAQGCEEHLVRKNPVPIVARIKQETLLLDVRTILGPDENVEIARALAAYFDNLNASA